LNIDSPLDTTIVGGGMITQMQILPSLYHLQRLEAIGNINICSLRALPLKQLARDRQLKEAFPGQSFVPFPDFKKVSEKKEFPELYKEVIAGMRSRQMVVVALPDHMHYQVIMHALQCNQHVICVKPLAMKYNQALQIEKSAFERGLFVGIDYHKRFDDRVNIARQNYRTGYFGEFKLGSATLIESWYYRDSNFQNWCTSENSDMFSYIGCHYIDQVHMITGLLPVQVSVYGIEERYPKGNLGYLWTNARVIWANGGSLALLNGMGYPNAAPGGNSQGLWLFMQGKHDGGILFHDDQYRGIKYSYIRKGTSPKESFYHEPNPEYFTFLQSEGKGLVPAGYGYRSIESIIIAIQRVEQAGGQQKSKLALKMRQKVIKEIDCEGYLATPANSSYNELVIEAGRLSILNGGREVVIDYGAKPGVHLKKISEYKKSM